MQRIRRRITRFLEPNDVNATAALSAKQGAEDILQESQIVQILRRVLTHPRVATAAC